jgi:hypothetical protein
MQKAQHLIGIGHVTYPCIPGSIFDPIPQSRKDKRDYKYWIWGVNTVDHIGKQMAPWPEKGHTALSKGVVNALVEKGGDSVAYQRRQENERHYRIGQVIV